MNNKVRLDRLNHLVTVLKAVPKVKFNMGTWYNPFEFRTEVCAKIPKNFVGVRCTSAACALGWASMDKKFRKSGLDYKSVGSAGEIMYKGQIDIDAGALFFGLTEDESSVLFYEEYYGTSNVTPAMVIKQVKILIKQYTKG